MPAETETPHPVPAAAASAAAPSGAVVLRTTSLAKAFGADAGAARLLVRAARRRGALHRRRERIGQVHAGEDPRRRPPPGRRDDRARRRAARARRARRGAPRPPASPPCSRRCSSSSRGRCSRTSGWAPTALFRTGVPAAREAPACASRSLDALLGAAPPLDMPVGAAVAERAPGLLPRPRAGARPADPDPRRGHLGAGRRHARPALRARARAGRGRRRGRLHLAPDGRDRRDRRPLHGDALGRDGGDARARQRDRRRSSCG